MNGFKLRGAYGVALLVALLGASVIAASAGAQEPAVAPAPFAPAEDCANGYDANGDGFADGTDAGCMSADDGYDVLADTAPNAPAGLATAPATKSKVKSKGGSHHSWPPKQCYYNCPSNPPAGTTCFNMAPTGTPTNGDDVVVGSIKIDIINSYAGNDRVCTLPGNDFVYGSSGDDMIRTGNEGDIGLGDGGNDVLFGGLGKDLVSGGSANDTVNGQDDPDIVSGDSGDDQLFGGSGNDAIYGGPGTDRCIGNSGTDKFYSCEIITDFAVGETKKP